MKQEGNVFYVYCTIMVRWLSIESCLPWPCAAPVCESPAPPLLSQSGLRSYPFGPWWLTSILIKVWRWTRRFHDAKLCESASPERRPGLS